MEELLDQLKVAQSDLDSFLPLLSDKILIKLQTDSAGVFNLLYQIDVSEEKAREAFKLKDDFLIAQQLAFLIIERQKQKIRYHSAF